jgi:sigma-B regulation protein RsbU (phosphoserine phosphatase)
VATIYPNRQSDTEYFVRMSHFGDDTAYNVDLHSMPKGEGGFLKLASTFTEPQIFPDISGDVTEGDLRVLPWLEGMRTALVVPTMSVSGDPATSVIFASEADAFDSSTIKSNVVLAYAMTNILLSWLLRLEADRVREALDEELASVGRIQREFLPKSLPDTEHFEWAVYYSTSACAGGDYYDFFTLPGGRTGVIIADVSGHGSPAAIVMAMTRLLLHTYPGDVSPPDEVFSNLNRLLVGNLLLGQFVTAFYCVLDPGDMSVRYSNAGHCHPVLLRSGDALIEKLASSDGLPLGVIKDGGFRTRCVKLNLGDILVLYTDGLREAMNEKKEMYGEERLVSVLKGVQDGTAEEIKNEILRDMCEFLSGEPLKDDLTIIVLRVLK